MQVKFRKKVHVKDSFLIDFSGLKAAFRECFMSQYCSFGASEEVFWNVF